MRLTVLRVGSVKNPIRAVCGPQALGTVTAVEREDRLRRSRTIALLLGSAALAWVVSAVVDGPAVHGAVDEPPPVQLDGRRVVSVRSPDGELRRITAIPSTSFFWTYRRTEETCEFTTTAEWTRLSSGARVPRGTRVISHYLFVEGVAAAFPLPPATLPPDVLVIGSRGPLTEATRTFTVFCDGTYYDANFVGFVSVVTTDALLDPRPRLDEMRNDLRLRRPVVVEPPVVRRRGGLVVRNPTWLAIGSDAWLTQRSNVEWYRGLELVLVAVPTRLDFEIRFVAVSDPAAPRQFTVTCLPEVPATAHGGTTPAPGDLADADEPGWSPCTWTPPARGSATITARIIYDITFWASGWTEPDDDYVWRSLPVTYAVGELTSPNTITWVPSGWRH